MTVDPASEAMPFVGDDVDLSGRREEELASLLHEVDAKIDKRTRSEQ